MDWGNMSGMSQEEEDEQEGMEMSQQQEAEQMSPYGEENGD